MHLLRILQNLMITAAILVVLVLGVYGVNIPDWFKLTTVSLGDYRLESSEAGLVVYQYGRVSPFYTVSTFNDYVTHETLGRVPHVRERVSTAGETVPRTVRERFLKVGTAIKAAFGRAYPTFTAKTEELTVEYQALPEEGGIHIRKRLNIGFNTIDNVATTLAYNSSDMVFSLEDGSLFSFGDSDSLIDQVASEYGFTLHTTEYVDDVVEVEGSIGIINPNIPGYLEIRTADVNQRMYINRGAQLIEVVEPYTTRNWLNGYLVWGRLAKGDL